MRLPSQDYTRYMQQEEALSILPVLIATAVFFTGHLQQELMIGGSCAPKCNKLAFLRRDPGGQMWMERQILHSYRGHYLICTLEPITWPP